MLQLARCGDLDRSKFQLRLEPIVYSIDTINLRFIQCNDNVPIESLANHIN